MGGGKRNRRKAEAEEKPKKSEREIRDVSRVAKRNLLSKIRKLFQNDPFSHTRNVFSLSLSPYFTFETHVFEAFQARPKRFEVGMPIIRTRGPDYILENNAYINSRPVRPIAYGIFVGENNSPPMGTHLPKINAGWFRDDARAENRRIPILSQALRLVAFSIT